MISGKEVEVWPVTFYFNQFLLRSDVRTRAYFLKKNRSNNASRYLHPVIYSFTEVMPATKYQKHYYRVMGAELNLQDSVVDGGAF